MSPFLLILSAPSGGGKTTIGRALLARREDLTWSVSATTRPPRPGERDGVDYHFLRPEEFERRVAAGDFLEWAEYGGHRYGTPRSEVDRSEAEGRHLVLDIEVQGAAVIRERCRNVVSVFIIPPTAEVLLERLGGRNTERTGDLVRRLRRALEELKEAPTYDYIVVNDNRERAVAEVAAIIAAEGRRPVRTPDLGKTVETLARDLAAELTRYDTGQT